MKGQHLSAGGLVGIVLAFFGCAKDSQNEEQAMIPTRYYSLDLGTPRSVPNENLSRWIEENNRFHSQFYLVLANNTRGMSREFGHAFEYNGDMDRLYLDRGWRCPDSLREILEYAKKEGKFHHAGVVIGYLDRASYHIETGFFFHRLSGHETVLADTHFREAEVLTFRAQQALDALSEQIRDRLVRFVGRGYHNLAASGLDVQEEHVIGKDAFYMRAGKQLLKVYGLNVKS